MEILNTELEKIARNYHLSRNIPDKFIEDKCQEFFTEWLTKKIKSTDKLLELGFGEGTTAAHLKNASEQYTIVEGSLQLFQELQRRHPEIDAVYDLFENFKSKSKYDKILALHTLEHLENPVKVLKNIANFMHNGSEIIVVVPNKNSIHRQLAFEMGLIKATDELSDRDKLVGHKRVYCLKTLKEHLEEANFEVTSEHGFFLKPFPNSLMLEYSDELLSALNCISPKLPADLLANICIVAKLRQ